ncbi:MAG: UDP-N-acetylmuramate dehydrogenase [Thermomicrobiaceae bacterium]
MAETIELTSRSGAVKIRPDQKLSLFTTFRIGGPAEFMARVTDLAQVEAALEWAEQNDLPVTSIGGGSNLLVDDAGVPGLVLAVRSTGKDAEAMIKVEEEADGVRIWVPAQMPISRLGHVSAARGWAGLVWCAGLPGVVGGAVVNNAGAHGGEMIDHLVSIDVVRLADRKLETWPAEKLDASYRYTVLKHAPRPRDVVVLGATFLLPRGDSEDLERQAKEFSEWRRQAQPTGACAGSVFTNPEGSYAGYLIDKAGLKGQKVGGVQISELHGNFMVNSGDATAEDVRKLIQLIQDEVYRQFEIRLVPEIEQVGGK